MTKEEERALELLRRTGNYTDEEYSLMDEYVSTHEIKVKAANRGILARNKAHLIAVDNLSAAYLNARAEGSGKTPGEIISELVREKIAAASA
jgi:hypothetical protein